MSLELELLPMQQGLESGFSHEIIRAGYMSRKSFEAVKKLNQLPIGKIYTYLANNEKGGTAYGSATKDSYGEKLKYTTAEELVPVSEEYFLKTATAFLKALDPQTPVVLYWH